MQTTLLSLAIAVILALLAALLGPHFIDWNAQRARFEQHASQFTGLPVRVAGPMDVRLLPSPTLVLSDVEIGKPGDPQSLRARTLGIEFALPPLLSGKFSAVEMRVSGPEIRLSLDGEGRAVVPAAFGGVNLEALSIEKLAVSDGLLELSDAASGRRVALKNLSFSGEVRALPGPFRGEGAFALDGAPYAYRVSTGRPEPAGSRIKFNLEPRDGHVVAEAEGLLASDNGAPRFEGNASLGRRIPNGKGDKGATVDPWRITAKVKANAASALLEQLEFQYGPDERALKLAGTAEARFGAQPRLDAVLSARQLDADKLLAGTEGVSMPPRAAIAAIISTVADVVKWPIPTQFGIGIDSVTLGGSTLQNLRGDLDIGRGTATLTGFEVRAPGFTQLQASGQLDLSGERTTFTGPANISSVDPRVFADWLDGKSGTTPMPARPIRLRGDVTLGAGRIAIERMNAEFDRKKFDGRLSYVAANEGGRARLDAQLRADDFDLDALLQIAGPAANLQAIERPDDIVLALTLGRLRAFGVEAENTDLRLALDEQALTIEKFSVGDLGGSAIDGKGRIELQKQSPRGTLTFDLDMRNPAGLTALAGRFAPAIASVVKQAAEVAAPAKLQGDLSIAPGQGNASVMALNVGGNLGEAQLYLKSQLTGQWNKANAGDLSLRATLNASNVNALTKFAGLDGLVTAPAQSGAYTLSLTGKLEGDLKLDARLSAAALDARAGGTLRSVLSNARSAALDLAIGPADVVVQRAQSGRAAVSVPVALKSGLKANVDGVRFDNLTAKIAGSDVRGRLGFVFGEPATIDGELRADTLNVGTLLATVTGVDLSPGERKTIWNEAPFVQPAWPALNGDVALNATRALVFPSTPATNLRTVLRFRNSEVTADAIEAGMFGGRGSGEATLRRGADGVGLQARIAIKDADAAPLLAGLTPSALTGRAGLQLQFEGAGLSPRALVGSLSGNAKITLDNARLAGLDPKAFAAAMRSVDQGLPLEPKRISEVVIRALEAGPLPLPNAEAALSIAAGVVRIESFAARTGNVELVANGSYNLADAGLDLRVALQGPEAAGIPQRPEVSILMRGPLGAPQRSLDVSALTGWLALRSVDQQTRRIEAIERGRPADTSHQAAESEPEQTSVLPDVVPQMPRRRPSPQAQPQPQPHPQPQAQPRPQSQPSARPQVEPLPPPIEIRPGPGDRRPPQRVENQPNPFPRPFPP